MAKKQDLGVKGLFTRTEPETPPPPPADNSDLDTGNIRPSGVGLREGEIAALDAIAKHYDLSRNALIREGARMLILAFRAGELDLADRITEPKQTRKRLKF